MKSILFLYTVLGMHTLFRKHNYRNIRLEQETENETVGVLRRNGEAHQVRWLGFITREKARQSAGKSVKLVVSRVGNVDLQSGEYVQGCLVKDGAYALTDSVVAVIGRHSKDKPAAATHCKALPFKFR